MMTDALIKAIATDAATRPPDLGRRLAVALAAGGVIAGALLAQRLGVRPDIADALQTWRFAAKLAIVLASLAAALWLTVRFARPDVHHRHALVVLALPVAMLALAICGELVVSPARTWATWAVGSNGRLCLISIALMSTAPLLALLGALRSGAPRSPAAAGAAAGLLAASLGAALYTVHCTDDSPLFVALWYTPALAAATLAGALAGARALRW